MTSRGGVGARKKAPQPHAERGDPILDNALRLHCSKCGSRDIKTVLNVSELYDRSYGGDNYQGT